VFRRFGKIFNLGGGNKGTQCFRIHKHLQVSEKQINSIEFIYFTNYFFLLYNKAVKETIIVQ
jgi:hypothetical protein